MVLIAALALMLLPQQALRYTGVGGVLLVWALLAARQAIEPIATLSARAIEVRTEITQVLHDKERLVVKIVEHDHKRIFPPIHASVTAEKFAEEWCAGQQWNMTLRLRPIHGRLNEGGFDAQRFALANNTPLQGRLLAASPLSQRCSWRQRLMNYAQQQYQHLPWNSVMTALLFGDRQGVTVETRALLRDTGIAHLMAISGMHIGLAASLGWIAARTLQFLLPAWRIRYPLPLLFSLGIAAAYCWLSGSSPPSIRAMTALTLWALVRLQSINCSSWQIWLICLGGILFIDPMAVLSDSFWLSVSAVAILLFWFRWFPLPARWRYRKRWMLLQLAHLQLGMMLLLIPIQVFIFHGVSLTSLPANIIAIPVVSFITVPALLLATVMPVNGLALPFWWIADRSLALLFSLLALLPQGWLGLGEAALVASLIVWLLLIAFRLDGWRRMP
ncbi:MAG: DNA internalization-related competence protein ComEC/Rec2, partial [Pantoea sp.]|nr:DNA internalization-related competence protein ComEC/Rec2 [Pantoea sp.]